MRAALSKLIIMLLLVAPVAFGKEADGVAAIWRHDPARDNVGRVYVYERTNHDGSLPERILVYRKSTRELEVFKSISPGQGAALVTAELDPATASAVRLTGGRLLPEAKVHRFAYLTWNSTADTSHIRVELPDTLIRNEAQVARVPWHVYDFDLASLSAMTPHLIDPTRGFSFGLALTWTDPSVSDMYTWLGEVTAEYEGEEVRLGAATLRYTLTGSAFAGGRATGDRGELWLDARDGHIVEAQLPIPNHVGYRDFRLRLLDVVKSTDAAWKARLRAHFAD
ncbi:MAG: hypothetical protein GF355_17080 [Candidatus Eisenbacteria bacterium]|nr:hypothetical protein [Candidatus Eisenbacteria bacterium]